MSSIQFRAPRFKISSVNLQSRLSAKTPTVQSAWESLEPAINAIFTETSHNVHPEILYKLVQSITLCGDEPSTALFLRLESHISTLISQSVSTLQSSPSYPILLSNAYTTWTSLSSKLTHVTDIFTSLDRLFVRKAHSQCMFSLFLSMLRSSLTAYTLSLNAASLSLSQHVLLAFTDAILEMRNGQDFDKLMMISVVNLIDSIDLYSDLEKFLFESCSDYYKNLSSIKSSMSTSQYLRFIENQIENEVHNFEKIVFNSTLDRFQTIIESNLFELYVDDILAIGFPELMKKSDYPSLSVLGRFLTATHSVDKAKSAMKSFIIQEGSTFMNLSNLNIPSKSGIPVINDLIILFNQCLNTVNETFKSADSFTSIVYDSFELFINRSSNVCKLFARHLDLLLSKSSNPELFESQIDSLIKIFRLVASKDVFAEYHRHYLAKRLLSNSILSEDLEKTLISKLKYECGSSFVASFEAMFTDINLSHELTNGFLSRHSELISCLSQQYSNFSISFNVYVCSISNWPALESTPLLRPKVMLELQQAFNNHYTTIYPSRRLEFVPDVGTCCLSMVVPRPDGSIGKFELVLSELLASVLMVFPKVQSMSFMDIEIATGIPEEPLKKALTSLINPKHMILLKKPAGLPVNKGDAFYPNLKFKSKYFRIKVLSDQSIEDSEKENSEIEERILIEREHLIDACVVRIMKMKRQLNFHELMAQVMQQSLRAGSEVDGKFIKKRLESLIDRDYLERDSSDSSLFNYVA
ncbi:hypothetical protein P9112_006721 [Eukaryota sp. TZLM1-RC]